MSTSTENTIVKSKSYLCEVLEERKAERKIVAEIKRNEGLRIIAANNSQNPNGKDPLRLFPQEIWDMIFDLVTSPQDLNSLRQSCTYFHKVLEKRYLRDILFPLVFEVEHFQNILELFPGVFNDTTQDYALQPIRTLRQVCKRWRDVVDSKILTDLQNVTISRSLTSDIPQLITFDYPSGELFRTPARLLESYDPNSPSSAKRFPSRSLEIEFRASDYSDEDDDLQRFIDSITKSLELIGSQIQYLRFSSKSQNFSSLKTYEALHRWISLMPNLQWLELLPFDFQEPGISELRDLLKLKPFPHLENLKRMTLIIQRSPQNNMILESILGGNLNLKELILDVNHFDLNISSGLLQNIKGLQLEGISIQAEKFSENPMVRIYGVTNFHLWRSSLKTIKLDFCESNLSIGTLFQYLNEFQLLETLDLTLYKIKDLVGQEVKGHDILSLPNLKSFSLRFRVRGFCRTQSCAGDQEIVLNGAEVPRFYGSIDYLQNCSKLETLRWDSTSNLDTANLKKVEQIIQFEYGFMNLHDSNIWKVFPSLRMIEVGKVENNEEERNRYVVIVYKRGEMRAEKIIV